MAATEMAAAASEITLAVMDESRGAVENKMDTVGDCQNEAETGAPAGCGQPNMAELEAEASEAPEQAASEAPPPPPPPPTDVPESVKQEAASPPPDVELPSEEVPPEPRQNYADVNGEHLNCGTEKDAKAESRCSGMEDCDKTKPSCDDGDKLSGGDAALGDKRRPSVEISSSDGEPLSRMDSEDSISSTLMEMESTVSSGRSTPAMMNGQGSASSSAVKAVAYSCCWDLCLQYFNSSPDLAEHIRGIHVDGQRGGVFVCLWKGCKVYNTPSTSQSWLQRHMLTHSGDKPFKCVVGGCTASFASQGGLARHVPSHFSQQSSSKMSGQAKLKEESPSKAGLNKRKKLKNKRRCSLPRPHDFFDAQTMDAIRHRAICLNLSTHIESVGNGHSVVFNSTVLAKRKEGSGKVKVLLHWTPEDILPDVWVNETDESRLKTKVVHLSQLPQETAMLLDPNIYRALPQKRLKQSISHSLSHLAQPVRCPFWIGFLFLGTTSYF
ncbi:zinc finger protein aebp2-like isoform X2 [Phycodurus eques]|uniref:zinc finger protein aebp2-like isoform X2 n=1 Tax=Phycodurus eques TaxID=693459 RepID=UPI002ACE695E|nr:zinc finger protein aebp2-like isoform X2 [Phycodurus eques]